MIEGKVFEMGPLYFVSEDVIYINYCAYTCDLSAWMNMVRVEDIFSRDFINKKLKH